MSSQITDALCALLQSRSDAGLAKYGTSLDRDDLTPSDWIKHTVEELLDGAGYLLALDREMQAQEALIATLQADNERLRAEEAIK